MSSKLWWPAYVGLGSNVGDSHAHLERAFATLQTLPDTRLVSRSPIYRSTPFGPVAQADFLNAVAGLLTLTPARELWDSLRRLELELGRSAGRVRWGPREIDLDLLVHGEGVLRTPELSVPHPGIPERDFVLYPLRDVAPTLQIPGLGRVDELASRVGDRGMRRLE